MEYSQVPAGWGLGYDLTQGKVSGGIPIPLTTKKEDPNYLVKTRIIWWRPELFGEEPELVGGRRESVSVGDNGPSVQINLGINIKYI